MMIMVFQGHTWIEVVGATQLNLGTWMASTSYEDPLRR